MSPAVNVWHIFRRGLRRPVSGIMDWWWKSIFRMYTPQRDSYAAQRLQ